MSDFNLKLLAEELGKSIENLAPQIEQELNDAVRDVANAAHAMIIARVQGMTMDPKNRQDYLKALKFEQLSPNAYLIFLDGDWPNKLEEGYGGYSIKDQLLSSKKIVQVGSRAGEPWVRTGAQGQKYAAVPFEHKPHSKDKGSGNLADDIKKMTAMNRAGREQKITKVFKDLDGNPIVGKVATSSNTDNQFLKGLTKYQHVSESGKVSSVYMTYRIVSENSSGWNHPGFDGYGIFREAEAFVEKELDNIIKTLL